MLEVGVRVDAAGQQRASGHVDHVRVGRAEHPLEIEAHGDDALAVDEHVGAGLLGRRDDRAAAEEGARHAGTAAPVRAPGSGARSPIRAGTTGVKIVL